MIRKIHKNNRNKTDTCLEGWGVGDTHFTGSNIGGLHISLAHITRDMCMGIHISRGYIYHCDTAPNVLNNFFPLIGRNNVKHYRILFGIDSLHKRIASNIVVNEKKVISNPVQRMFQTKLRVSPLKTHCWCFRLSRSLWTGLWSSGEHATLPRRFFGDFIYFFDPVLFFHFCFRGLIRSERKKCIRLKE